MTPPLELVDAAPLVPILRDWIDRGGRLDLLPQGPCRRARAVLAGEQAVIRIDALDRLGVALDMPALVTELAPDPGRGRYGAGCHCGPCRAAHGARMRRYRAERVA